jgi:hypothetical protein
VERQENGVAVEEWCCSFGRGKRLFGIGEAYPGNCYLYPLRWWMMQKLLCCYENYDESFDVVAYLYLNLGDDAHPEAV